MSSRRATWRTIPPTAVVARAMVASALGGALGGAISDPNDRHAAGIEHTEHGIQVSLVAWAKENEPVWPELEWLFAIPNGGHRSKATAVKLRLEGVKPGVSDLFLPVARCGFHGLWLEMKAGDNKPTVKQRKFQAAMRAGGYAVVTAWSMEAARTVILSYLAGAYEAGVLAPPAEAH